MLVFIYIFINNLLIKKKEKRRLKDEYKRVKNKNYKRSHLETIEMCNNFCKLCQKFMIHEGKFSRNGI